VDHRQVAVSAADRDLVDGQAPEILERGPSEAPLEVLLEQPLHQIPAHAQMMGHVRHRHVTGELEHVAGEALRVAVLARSERDLGPPDAVAALALQPGDLQHDPDRPGPDRQRPETAWLSPSPDHPTTPAGHAAKPLRGLHDVEVNLASDVLRTLMDVALQPERVVQ